MENSLIVYYAAGLSDNTWEPRSIDLGEQEPEVEFDKSATEEYILNLLDKSEEEVSFVAITGYEYVFPDEAENL